VEEEHCRGLDNFETAGELWLSYGYLSHSPKKKGKKGKNYLSQATKVSQVRGRFILRRAEQDGRRVLSCDHHLTKNDNLILHKNRLTRAKETKVRDCRT
jgi:hypothetical protein